MTTMVVSPKFQRILIITCVVFAILVVAFFSSLPLLVRSQYLESLVRRTVQEQMGYELKFERLRLSLFPVPVLHIESLELNPSEDHAQMPFIKAEKALFRPSLFSLVLGRPELAYAAVKHADIHHTWRGSEGISAKAISIQDVSFDVWNIRPNRPIRFQAKGKFLNDSENIWIDGNFETDFSRIRPEDLVSKVRISLDPLELSRLVNWWGASLPIQINRGILSFSVEIIKGKDSPSIGFIGAAAVENLVYQQTGKMVASAPAGYQFKFKLDLDLDTGQLRLSNTTLTAPFAGSPFAAEAKLNARRWNIDEILIKSKSLRLDVLPQYILPFQEALPVSLGFSGESQVDFLLKGTPALFLIHSNFDLTQATLAYSKYFSKPIGIPLSFKSDLKLAGLRVLRGDFSFEFEQAAFKGSLVGLDLRSGEGEMTILTNKFNVDQWQNYFPPLRQVELIGSAKVLTSAKGNFNHPGRLRVMNNITLDRIQIKAKNGAEVCGLSGSIDIGPVDSELKGFQVTLGESQFFAQGKMFRQPDLRWLLEVKSPFVHFPKVISTLNQITEAIQIEGVDINLDGLEKAVHQFFPGEEVLESFNSQIAYEQGRFMIPTMRFGAFGGNVLARATYDLKKPSVPSTRVELEIDRLNLARLQSGSQKPLFYGNLFAFVALAADGPFDSEWPGRLRGQGSVAVTNGELQTIDLLGSLGQIAELAALSGFKSGTTRFNDIRWTFTVLNQKIQTNDLFLLSDDFQIDGKGDIQFDGNLNLRLSVYLLPSLGRKIVSQIGENSKLGPIPVLISGPATGPFVKADPMLIQTFLESLIQQQFSKITERFFPAKQQAELPPAEDTVQSGKETKGKSQSLEEALVESGLGLLDQFLSKKEPTS